MKDVRSVDVKAAESLSLLRELVKIGSVNPYEGRGSGEIEIAEFISARLKAYGLDTRLQSVEGTNGRRRANVVGTLKGSGGRDGRSLMLNGHIDTVDVATMKIDPFGALLDEQGRLHGRGACDMKGSIASMMAAIKAVVDRGMDLQGDLVFAGVVDEEYMSLGTKRLIEDYRTDGAIVGEPTSLKVGLAHKGYVWMEVEVKGKPAHGSVPEQGVDAILEMGEFIVRLPGLRSKYAKIRHPLLGSPTIHASMIEGGTEWSVLPEACRLKVERRTLPGEKGEDAVAELEEIAVQISRDDKQFSSKITKFFEQGPMEVPPDAEIVKSVARSYQEVTGAQPDFVGVPYWTDAAILMNGAGIPTCLFGPGDIRLAHSEDEWVQVDEVAKGAGVFASAILSFCGVDQKS